MSAKLPFPKKSLTIIFPKSWKHHLRPRHIKAAEARPTNLQQNVGTGFLLVNITFYPGIFLSLPTANKIMKITSKFVYSKFPVELLGKLHRKLNELCRLKGIGPFFRTCFLLVKNLKKIASQIQNHVFAHLVGLDKIAWNNSKWWPGWSGPFSNVPKKKSW